MTSPPDDGQSDPLYTEGAQRRLRQHLLKNRAKLKAGYGRLGRKFRYRIVPRFPRLICELEWLVSATEGRVLSFYLEHDPEHDVLWQRCIYDSGLTPPWSPVASMVKVGAPRAECAGLLITHYLLHLSQEKGWGRFYGISNTGLIDVAELRRIADSIWT